MLSLHHITHAVSVVVICFLIKKYIELRVQHTDLKYKYEGLMVSCASTQHENSDETCSCMRQSNLAFAQSETGTGHVEVSTEAHQSVYATLSEREMFEAKIQASEVMVDDYGKTLGYAAEENDVQPHFQDSSGAVPQIPAQLPPLDQAAHGQQPVVQPSFTFSSSVSMATKRLEVLNGRLGVDGKTEVSDVERTMAASLDRTSESLEVVKLSPSSTDVRSESEPQEKLTAAFSTVSTTESDFYLGSRINEAVEKNEQQILTTGSFSDMEDLPQAAHGTPFIPAKVETSFDEIDEGDWEDDVADEENKPSLVRLPQQQLSDSELEKLVDQGSSAQCSGKTVSDRTCRFQNLCFDKISEKFLFLNSRNSVFLNIPILKDNEALLELSTVAGHNAQNFFYTTVPADHIRDFDTAVIPGTTVVFKRFKPDNVMHVLHDDIIPLFHTLQSVNVKPHTAEGWDGRFPVSVFLADENDEGEFLDLYDTFAGNGIFTRESLAGTESRYLCLPEAYVGLSKGTTWYQYGFFEPQGPITDSTVTSYHIHSVSSHLLNHFASDCLICGAGGHLVLILRKETRLILNEMDLVMGISKEFRLKVMTVSFETHNLSDMIPIIHSSRGIIGMHGSLLSLAMFLRQGSILVELFPYAVNSSKYTPYKTLCEVPGMSITYRAWTNQNPENTVGHPDWPSEFGGVHHLPIKQQQEIVAQTEVPPHLCCEDPSWLYHIFQDTLVNIPEVLALVKSGLEEGRGLWVENDKLSVAKGNVIPSPVKNLKCQSKLSQGKQSFVLQWEPPWNVEFLQGHNLKYSIHMQDTVSGKSLHMNSGRETMYQVSKGIAQGVKYVVRVRCILNGVQGPFASMVMCHT